MKNKWISVYFIIAVLTGLFYSSNPVGNVAMMVAMMPFAIFTVILFAIFIFKKKYKNITKSYFVILLTLTIIYLAHCLIIKGFSFRELYAYAALIFGVGFIGSAFLENNIRENIKCILEVVAILSFLAAIFGLYCYFTKTTIWHGASTYGFTYDFPSASGSITSIMTNVNSYALVCAIAIMVSVILIYMSNNKIYKVILLGNVIINLINMLITASRTALLALIIFGLSYIILFYKSKMKNYILIGVMCSIFIFIIGIKFNVISSEIPLIGKMVRGDFSSGRVDIWIASFEVIKDNFLWGVGIRNGVASIGEVIGNPENTLGTHNGYISIMLANGIILFTALISLIGYYLYNIKNVINKSISLKLMICFIVAMLFANITESILFGDINYPTMMLWIIMILSYNLGVKEEKIRIE